MRVTLAAALILCGKIMDADPSAMSVLAVTWCLMVYRMFAAEDDD